MKETHLSPKKQRFVDFIKTFTKDHRIPPTFIEIMEGLGISSLGTINWYVNELEKEGVIERVKGQNGKRSLSVLEQKIDNRLPLLGLVSAGYPLEVFQDNEYVAVPSQYIKRNNFALRVNGDSMKDDGILNNDIIVVKKTETAFKGETVIAYINDEATLKEFYIDTTGNIELRPKNNDYNTIHVDPSDDFKIGGIVLAVIREYQ